MNQKVALEDEIYPKRLSRRSLLMGICTTALASLGAMAVTGCSTAAPAPASTAAPAAPKATTAPAAAATAAPTQAPAASKKEKITFKLGHEGSDTWQGNMLAKGLADNAAKASDGQIDIQVFPNGQIGKSRDLQEGMQFGTIDMGAIGSDFFYPDFDVLSTPFLFTGREHMKKVLASPVGDELKKGWENKGMKYLALIDIGVRHITNNKRPINTADDLKGLKMRVVPSPVFLETFKALGATTVPIAFADLYVALQQNVVDGEENPTTTLRVMKYYEVQKYVSLTGHMLSTTPILVSTKRWQGLSADIQKIILDSAAKAEADERAFMVTDEETSLKFVTTEGKMVANTPTDQQSFVTATKNVPEKISTSIAALAEKIRAAK
ncbi:MAG: TRAP transporter substrate-binding protein [Chloroflexota bacterium]